MLSNLAKPPLPNWLALLSPATMKSQPFPLSEILRDSLYYPSSGFDGRPVEHLGGHFFSFIYVDYSKTRDELKEQIESQRYGFNGYELLSTRDVMEQELTPHGWSPLSLQPEDGDPTKYRDYIRSPYCSWMVFQRDADLNAEHGPARFSLMHLCADGVAAFQALYHGNKAVPKAVAIIRPGTGFGLNWTDYRAPHLIFHRSVLGNPAGAPEMLLCDSGENSYWPEYQLRIGAIGNGIGLWGKIGTQS